MSEGGEARMRQRWWMSNDRRDEGEEARNHEAEVEAVARAILGPLTAVSRGDDPGAVAGRAAEAAIAALDAVRPRNHEAEVERLREALGRIADGEVDGVGDYSECVQLYARQVLDAVRRSLRGGDHIDCPICGKDLDHEGYCDPQGGDHEAGIQAALNAYHAKQPHETIRTAMERAIAAYLSRCSSPERNTESRVSQDHDPGRDD